MLFWVAMRQRRAMPSEAHGYGDLKDRVCRTLESLAENPAVRGGIPVGGRALFFVIDAEDHATLDAMLQNLPLWDLMDDVEVTPMTSFRDRLSYNRDSAAGSKGG